ncbi:MAG: SEC-C metal-binding domain-containing protein [Acidimicrobiales bacterium]
MLGQAPSSGPALPGQGPGPRVPGSRDGAVSPRPPTNGQRRTAPQQHARPGAPAVPRKVGRNDPCWCGSGRKFKLCHGAS